MTYKLHSIQYLRGIAALMVVVAHAFAHPLPTAPVWTWVLGRLGVTLFFIISGFIMVAATGTGSFSPSRFLFNRFLRVVPLYWTITLISAAGALLVPSLFHKTIFDLQHLLGSLLFIPMLRPGNPGMIEPFVKLGWTLNYEVFFYVAFAALSAFSVVLRVVLLAAVFGGLAVAGQIFVVEQTQLKFYMAYDLLSFVAGCALGAAYTKRRFDSLDIALARIFAAASVAAMPIVLFMSWTKDPRMDRQIGLIAISIGLLAAGLILELRGKLAQRRVLQFLGDSSYSIYLAHMFAIGTVVAISFRIFGRELNPAAYVLTALVGVVGGLIIGSIFYLFIEKRFFGFFKYSSYGKLHSELKGEVIPVDARCNSFIRENSSPRD